MTTMHLLTDDRMNAATEKITAAMQQHGRAGDELLFLGLKQRIMLDDADGSLMMTVNFPSTMGPEPRHYPIDEALALLFAPDGPELQIARGLDAACELRRKQEIDSAERARQAEQKRIADDAERRRWDAWNRQDRAVRALQRLSLTKSRGATPADLATAFAAEETQSAPPEGWTAQ